MDAEDRAMQGAIAESEAGDCMDAGGRTMQGAIVEEWRKSPQKKHLALTHQPPKPPIKIQTHHPHPIHPNKLPNEPNRPIIRLI